MNVYNFIYNVIFYGKMGEYEYICLYCYNGFCKWSQILQQSFTKR